MALVEKTGMPLLVGLVIRGSWARAMPIPTKSGRAQPASHRTKKYGDGLIGFWAARKTSFREWLDNSSLGNPTHRVRGDFAGAILLGALFLPMLPVALPPAGA